MRINSRREETEAWKTAVLSALLNNKILDLDELRLKAGEAVGTGALSNPFQRVVARLYERGVIDIDLEARVFLKFPEAMDRQRINAKVLLLKG